MNKIKKFFVGGIVSALLLGSAATAFAVGNNGSFELGTDPGSYAVLSAGDNTSITDWTVQTGSVDYIGTYWTASNGSRSIDLSGNGAGSISQTLTTVAGHEYKVTFDMAGNPDGAPTVKELEVDADGTSETFTFDVTGKTTAVMGWESKTFNFTATDASTVLTFTSMTETAFGPAVDNVVVEDVTPTQNIPNQCDQNLVYNVINGTDGSDTINGTAGNDLIRAGDGSDKVSGKGGNDCIVGGDGSDTLLGDAGDDVILGQDGADKLEGGADNDTLLGGASSDKLLGGGGNDDLRGQDGSDSLEGGAGADTLLGGEGSDSLKGDGGNDILNGQSGMDSANGGANNDTCTAESESQCEV